MTARFLLLARRKYGRHVVRLAAEKGMPVFYWRRFRKGQTPYLRTLHKCAQLLELDWNYILHGEGCDARGRMPVASLQAQILQADPALRRRLFTRLVTECYSLINEFELGAVLRHLSTIPENAAIALPPLPSSRPPTHFEFVFCNTGVGVMFELFMFIGPTRSNALVSVAADELTLQHALRLIEIKTGAYRKLDPSSEFSRLREKAQRSLQSAYAS